jgi:hypothetical protein
LYGAVPRRKNDDFTLHRSEDLTTRLRPRPLFYEQKLATGKITVRPAQESRQLQGEGDRSINILMKAVIIAGTITK